MSAVSVKLVVADERRRGYVCAVISTPLIDWVISEKHFEEIHGLSRVVLLIPDKLAITLDVVKSVPETTPTDRGFFVNLVSRLCTRYLTITANRPPVNPLFLEENRGRTVLFDFEVDDGLREVVRVGYVRRGFSFYDTLHLLRSRLNVLVRLARDKREADFNAEGELVVKFADSVRALCSVYLQFVHPVLIASRRFVGQEARLDEIVMQRQLETIHLLRTTRERLTKEFHFFSAEREARVELEVVSGDQAIEVVSAVSVVSGGDAPETATKKQ